MYAGGCHANKHVARLHLGAVNDLILIYNAHRKTCEVIVVLRHHARVLCGLAADERAAGLHAALRNTLYDLCNLLRHVLAAGDVIEEKERFCAAAYDVVHAHGNAVNADGVMLIEQHGRHKLRAHAVCAGNEHRFFHTGHVRLEKAAETADAGNHARNACTLYVLFHQLYGLVACCNVNARCLVAIAVTFHSLTSLFL